MLVIVQSPFEGSLRLLLFQRTLDCVLDGLAKLKDLVIGFKETLQIQQQSSLRILHENTRILGSVEQSLRLRVLTTPIYGPL